jgi:hypothetical protein
MAVLGSSDNVGVAVLGSSDNVGVAVVCAGCAVDDSVPAVV